MMEIIEIDGASGTKYLEVWLTDLKNNYPKAYDIIKEFMHQGYKPVALMPLPEPPKEEE